MKGLKPFLSLITGLLAFAIMTGCAGSTPQNGPGALNVAQFTLGQGVVGVPYKQLLVASGGLTPYTWTISNGTLPPGINLASDGILSGTPTSAGTYNFTAKVTDSQTPVAAFNTYAGTITVNPPLTLTPTTLPTATVGLSYNATITANGGLEPYAYTIAFGTLPPGLALDPGTGAITGAPTAAGTFNFTVQVSDSASEVATAAYVITAVGRLQGNYAFTFNGFDTSQPAAAQAFYMIGSFVADGNGNITSGFLDYTDANGVLTSVPLTGAYYLPGGTNLGTLDLFSSLGNYQCNIVISTTSDSKIILADASQPLKWGSGLVKKQTTTLLPGGVNYSFGLFGNDSAGARLAGAGMFALTTSLSITGGAEDLNDNGTPSGELAITGGSMTTPDVNTGRGTATFTNSAGTTSTYAYYVVSGSELIALETDSPASQQLLSIQQQQAAGPSGGGFSNSSLKGQAVLELNGVSTASGTAVPDISTGVVSFDGASNISRSDGLPGYFVDENDGGNVAQLAYNGGYNVDPTCGAIASCGRVSMNLFGYPTTNPILYLVSANQGFVVGTDASATQGTFQQQSGFPYSLPSLLGSYSGGTITPVLSSVTNEVEVASTPPPGGIFAVTFDSNGPGAPAGGSTNQTFNGAYALDPTYGAAYGRFIITDSTGATVTILYVAGSGSAGITGSKTGLVGLNVGASPDAPDPTAPRLTGYGR